LLAEFPPRSETIDNPAWLRARWHDDGLTQAEIAALAEVSVRTVRNRIRAVTLAAPPPQQCQRPLGPPKPRFRRSRFAELNTRPWIVAQKSLRQLMALLFMVGYDTRVEITPRTPAS
jgi:hypothetical protein